MAIDYTYAAFLKQCPGVDWSETLTLGRLNLHLCNSELKRVLGGDVCSSDRYDSSERFAEPFFQLLGAKRVESLDASGFEGASIVHDLNFFNPDLLHGQFTAVVDAGTLEHVFYAHNAIYNSFIALKQGGHLMISSPTNNYCGHGDTFIRIVEQENLISDLTKNVAANYLHRFWRNAVHSRIPHFHQCLSKQSY